jgi:hypothetical protein
MKSKILLFIIAGTFLFSAIAHAHHSFGAVYDGKKTIKIEGELKQFSFRNPHSFVNMEAPDESGVMQRWALEWSAAGALGGQGVNAATLKVGDHIIVTGHPSRVASEYRMQLQTLKRPSDGFTWGNRPGETNID